MKLHRLTSKHCSWEINNARSPHPHYWKPSHAQAHHWSEHGQKQKTINNNGLMGHAANCSMQCRQHCIELTSLNQNPGIVYLNWFCAFCSIKAHASLRPNKSTGTDSSRWKGQMCVSVPLSNKLPQMPKNMFIQHWAPDRCQARSWGTISISGLLTPIAMVVQYYKEVVLKLVLFNRSISAHILYYFSYIIMTKESICIINFAGSLSNPIIPILLLI